MQFNTITNECTITLQQWKNERKATIDYIKAEQTKMEERTARDIKQLQHEILEMRQSIVEHKRRAKNKIMALRITNVDVFEAEKTTAKSEYLRFKSEHPEHFGGAQ